MPEPARRLALPRRRFQPAVAAAACLAVAGLAAALPGSPAPADADALELRARTVPLHPRDATRTQVGELEFLAGFALSSDDPRWGGFSSMALLPSGDGFLVISDFGYWTEFAWRHDQDGRLVGIDAARSGALPGPDGRPLVPAPGENKVAADAEGLARLADGSWLVSFEWRHRLWHYPASRPPFAKPPAEVALPPAVAELPNNSGLESVVALPQGGVLLIAEGSSGGDDGIKAWLGDGTSWARLTWRRHGLYRPTDATLLPDGRLLVLERRFTLLGGPGARLSVVEDDDLRAGARIEGRPIAEIAPPLTVDNFEAVAARRAPDGGVLIYILSDDNTSLLQRTLLLQFLWHPDDRAASAAAGD